MSTFHATRLDGPKWKMLSLNYFLDSITKDKDKLIHMGVLGSFSLGSMEQEIQIKREANCEEAKVRN